MKKIVSAFCAALVLSGMTSLIPPVPASAADFTLEAPSLTALRGEPVEVKFQVKGNPGFNEFNFAFSFDEALSPVMDEDAPKCTSGYDGLTLGYCSGNRISFGLISTEKCTKDDVLATFWLTVPLDATPGTVYTIDFLEKTQEASLSGNHAVPKTVSGKITVSDAPPYGMGDANEDGKLTVSDAVLLARVLAEDTAVSITPEGSSNADLDGVTGLSQEDLTLLLKLLAGTYAF